MSDVLTASETKQIMDFLQSMDKKLDIHIARTEEQFKTLRVEMKAEINELRAEVKAEINELRVEVKGDIKALNEKIDDLRDRQRVTDTRLWAFVVGLVTLVGGGVIKVLWFDRG